MVDFDPFQGLLRVTRFSVLTKLLFTRVFAALGDEYALLIQRIEPPPNGCSSWCYQFFIISTL